MDKCCRNCYRYKDGKCTHPFMVDRVKPRHDLLPVERVSEEGLLYEAVKEGFTEKDFKELSDSILAVTSKKKHKTIMEKFWQELEEGQDEWALEIDEVVCRVLKVWEEGDEKAIEIKCPDEMSCIYFE